MRNYLKSPFSAQTDLFVNVGSCVAKSFVGLPETILSDLTALIDMSALLGQRSLRSNKAARHAAVQVDLLRTGQYQQKTDVDDTTCRGYYQQLRRIQSQDFKTQDFQALLFDPDSI